MEYVFSDQDIIDKPSIRSQDIIDKSSFRNYFNDQRRKVDFVLVCNTQVFESEEDRAYIYTFVSNLEAKGLHFEKDDGKAFPDLTFIKLHGPKEVLKSYADIYKIPLACDGSNALFQPHIHFDFIATDVTKAETDNPISKRAARTLSAQPRLEITSIERIVILDRLLSKTPYSQNPLDYGLSKLLYRGTLIAAYPLHVGPHKWYDFGLLNDRQLLARYWANPKMWHKQQPLELIHRYLGPEVSLYFSFCGFYNKMLILASCVGFVCFLFGVLKITTTNYLPLEELCASEKIICPDFFKHKSWKFTLLKESCSFAKITYMFDNNATIMFAFFMTFWATIFVELWKRKYSVLLLRWNLNPDATSEEQYRREYSENTKYRRVSPITGTVEAYVPKRAIVFHWVLSFTICSFMVIIVLAAVFGAILVRLTLSAKITMSNITSLRNNVSILSVAIGSYISVIFITLFSKWYSKVSMWLTIIENPRTQAEFDESYTYKRFLLSFVNNYAALIYVAFMKGKIYTYPGDTEELLSLTTIRADLCHPAGCITGLCIQLAFIMLFKSITGNIISTTFSLLVKKAKGIFTRESLHEKKLPQWELDYNLKETGRYFLIGEYSEMIIQYGFVTCFAAAFPLAPLCALISNTVEIRTDANKYVRNYRRPIPVRVSTLGAWNQILQALTFLSMGTNAFLIAFTSDFVQRDIYRYNVHHTLAGYIETTLSEFNLSDLQNDYGKGTCFYRGKRNPPSHQHKYQLSGDYWYELSMRFIVAIIFEHVMLAISGILAYAIPDIPYDVKSRLKHHENKEKERRMQELKGIDRGTNIFGDTQ